MVSIAGFTPARWLPGALLRWLTAPTRTAEVALDAAPADPAPAGRRHYPPQRDRVFEQAAMAREMYRL